MTSHPEQKSTEVFLGNCSPSGELTKITLGYKTARMGKVPYDLNGHALVGWERENIRPLFIGVSEYAAWDKMMMARLRIARGYV